MGLWRIFFQPNHWNENKTIEPYWDAVYCPAVPNLLLNHQLHDGSIAELDGMTTYHVYAVCTNPEDEVSAVYGDAFVPSNWFEHRLPAFFSAFQPLNSIHGSRWG